MNTIGMKKTEISQKRLESAYESEKPRLMARMRSAGKSLEEAEDLVHDVFAEIAEGLDFLAGVNNLPGWIHRLFTRRMIDAWRHEKVRRSSGETNVSEETLNEIISETGLDPLDQFVRDSLVDALNAAIKVLPELQRNVIESQVFGGMTFKKIAEHSGESIDTIKARKRYAVRNLSQSLRYWISE